MAGEVQALNRFHEWSLSRQQRRLRRLIWAVGALGVLVAIALVALVAALGGIRADVDRLSRTSASVPANGGGAGASELASLNEQVAALRSEIAELESTDSAPGRRQMRRLADAVAGLESQLVAATECLEGAILGVHQGLEGLLDRSISANAYIRNVSIPDC